MRALILVLMVSISTSSALAQTIENGNWEGPDIELHIKGNEIVLNDGKYTLEKEFISKADSLDDGGWGGSHTHLCTAVTHWAHKTATGEIVLLSGDREKLSRSAGAACGFSRDVSKFSQPYAFEQFVISRQPDGTLQLRTIRFSGALGQPTLKIQDLQNPHLLEDRTDFKAFLEENDRFGKWEVKTLTVVK